MLIGGKNSDNQGLGLIYNYWTNKGYHAFDKGTEYDSKDHSFTQTTSNDILHIDYIAQGTEAKNAWSTFILDDSKGFTKAGVERINDSIQTYCWAILGSQGQTRTSILVTGTAFDAQKQFLPSLKIARYQSILKYARSKVDFVYGIVLYISPSNMELRIDTFQDYNNKFVIATEGLTLGLNAEANTVPIPPRSTSTVEGTKTKQTHPEPVSDVATGVATSIATGGASSGVPGFPSGNDVPSTPYKKQVQDYAKKHNLPQSWIDKISADPSRFERWLADRSMGEKIRQDQRRTGWKQKHPDQPLPDKYPAANNTKTIKLH